MKLALRILLLFLGATWVEQSLIPFLLPLHISFRLVTLLIINLAFLRGPEIGSIAGFLCGILVSLLAQQPLGIQSLSLCCVGWSAGLAAERLHMNIPGVSLFITVGLLALEWGLTFGASMMFGIAYAFSWIDFAASLLAAPLVFWVSRPFFTRPSNSPLYS